MEGASGAHPAGTWKLGATLKLLWEKPGTGCCAFLLILLALVYIASRREASNSTSKDREASPMTTVQVWFRGFIICIPYLAAGFNIAVLGADVASIQSDFGISPWMVGWVAPLSCVGSVVGALMNSIMSDLIGRKRTHFHLTLVLLFGHVLIFVASSFWIFLCGRFFAGIAYGGIAALAPVYLAEIAPMKHRGLLVSCTEQVGSGGLLFGFASAAFSSWGFREHGLMGLCFPVVTLALAPRLSESPRWLIQQGRIDEARLILQRYIPDEEESKCTLNAASKVVADNTYKSYTYFHSVHDLVVLLIRNKQQLFVPALIMILEEVVGIEVSDSYCIEFLQEAGVPHRSVVASATMTMVAIKAVVLMISGSLIDRWGRKPSLLFSLGGVFMTLAGFAYSFGSGPWQVSLALWVFYNLFYGAGLGNVCIVMMAEAFPDAKVRSIGVACCYILNRFMAAVMTGLFPWQHYVWGVQNVFYFWSLSALIGFIITAVFMKESAGQMLEHVAGK